MTPKFHKIYYYQSKKYFKPCGTILNGMSINHSYDQIPAYKIQNWIKNSLNSIDFLYSKSIDWDIQLQNIRNLRHFYIQAQGQAKEQQKNGTYILVKIKFCYSG